MHTQIYVLAVDLTSILNSDCHLQLIMKTASLSLNKGHWERESITIKKSLFFLESAIAQSSNNAQAKVNLRFSKAVYSKFEQI